MIYIKKAALLKELVMKRTLLFGLALGLTSLSFGQCDITGVPATMCLGDAPVSMSVESPGATYTGPGVDGDVFTPAAAGLGTHTIDVEAPGEGYSVESGTFDPIDITSGSTSLFMGDDNVSGALPIGFTFTFFGTDYTNFHIGSNGFITFSSGMPSGCCTGQLLPSGTNPNNLIAFAWEDLDPGNGGAPVENVVRYKMVGTAPNRILVVEFYNVDHWSNGNNVTLHTQLYETTNCIEIHTTAMPSDGGLHTQGIENASGTEAYTAPGRNRVNWSAFGDMWSFCPNVGCTGSYEVEVVAGPNVEGVIDAEEICLGDEVTVTATGTADEYDWGVSIEDGVAFMPDAIGENFFIVAGTDLATGCVSTDMVSVFVHDIPYVYAGDDMSVCEDDMFTLEAVGDEADYAWDNGAVDGEPMMQDVGDVIYTVTATNAGGCESTSSVTVTSMEAPTGTGVVTMMTGDGYDGSIDFTPEGGTGGPYTYSWSNGATTEDIDALTVGSYTVTVSDGMCDSDVTFIVDSQAGVELNELDNISVYPNPVVDILTVNFEGQYNWLLYDASGKIVAAGQGNGIEEISMDAFEAGNYLIKIAVEGAASTISVVKQ